MAMNAPSEGQPLIDPTNIATTGPYAGLPILPEGMVWHQFPWNSAYLSDPGWYDSLGINALDRREVWSITDNAKLHEVLQELLDEFPEKGMVMMFKAAVKGRPEMIRWLLSKGVKAHPEEEVENDDMSCVPAHAAAFNGNLDCLKILIEEAGVSVDAQDDMKGTPLMRAAKGKWPEIVDWLIEKGASLTAAQETNGQGEFNSLDFAALVGDMRCLTRLFQAMSDKFGAEGQDPKDIVTSKALQAAAYSGNVEILRYLFDKGGFPQIDDGETGSSKELKLTEFQKEAIEMALQRAQPAGADLLRVLLSYLTTSNEAGQLAFFQTSAEMKGRLLSIAENAIGRGDREAFKLVWRTTLDSPSDEAGKISIISDRESLELSRQDLLNGMVCSAVEVGHLDVVKILVGYGADINTAHGQSFTPPLYTAAAKNHVEIVRYLLEDLDADIDRAGGRYANGPTALGIAVIEGRVEIAKLLLMHGGPIETIEKRTEPEKATQLVVSSANVYRQQLKVVVADDSYIEGPQTGNSTIIVKLDEGDSKWLEGIRERKSDEELAKTDPFGRECRLPDETT